MSTVRATSHADAHRSNLAEACRLLGLPEVAGARQVDASFLHRRLKAGQRLTSQGEPFEALYIVAEGFDETSAAKAIASGEADLVAFGKPFISNPDLPARYKKHARLTEWDNATFYQGGPKGDTQGYTDYPALT